MKELGAKGLGLAAISYDPPETLAAFSRQRGITFPLLSDAGSATIKRYGILNTVADQAVGPDAKDPDVSADVRTYVAVNGGSARMLGIPFPGTFVLDRNGVVKARFFEDSYVERNTVSSVLMRMGGKAERAAGTRAATEHLDVTTYTSDGSVAPGNRFSLAINVTPRAHIHVYAPGASGYQIIGVTIAPQPFLRVLPLKYPSAQIYEFKPLRERVPVFEKPFTLVQEIVLQGDSQAQAALRGKDSLTLTGTLDYQACNDKLCFNPTSVPLSWTLALRPIVFERPTR